MTGGTGSGEFPLNYRGETPLQPEERPRRCFPPRGPRSPPRQRRLPPPPPPPAPPPLPSPLSPPPRAPVSPASTMPILFVPDRHVCLYEPAQPSGHHLPDTAKGAVETFMKVPTTGARGDPGPRPAGGRGWGRAPGAARRRCRGPDCGAPGSGSLPTARGRAGGRAAGRCEPGSARARARPRAVCEGPMCVCVSVCWGAGRPRRVR